MKFKSTAFLYLYVLFALLLLLPLSVIVNAQETELTTVVPTTHNLTIEIGGKGSVFVDGKVYFKTTEIAITRFAAPLIELKASENYCLDTVFFNGENITEQISNGKWTMPAMIADSVIEVDYEPESEIPATGDNNCICLWLLLLILALIGLIICISHYYKSRKQAKHP